MLSFPMKSQLFIKHIQKLFITMSTAMCSLGGRENTALIPIDMCELCLSFQRYLIYVPVLFIVWIGQGFCKHKFQCIANTNTSKVFFKFRILSENKSGKGML